MTAANARKRPKTTLRPRLEDLAAACGVSVATVSRALAGGRGVRRELADRILHLARETHYALPSGLAGRRIFVLASPAAMEDFARSQFTREVMEGLQERGTLLRATVESRAIGASDGERRSLIDAARDDSVAGLLLLTVDDEELLTAARGLEKPVVLINGDDPMMRLSSVAPSNRAAAALATDHLVRLGHRRILFLMRRGRRTIERRLEGWRDRLWPGRTHDPDMVVEVADWLPDLAAAAIQARIEARGGCDFTAILAAGDSLAIGAMQALARAGVAVPDQVSVMGMDGLPQGAFFTPALSAVAMPMREIGAAAVDLLRDLGTGPELPARRIELACTLLLRASCGPAP